MLKIHICREFPKDCITKMDGYFHRNKEKDWFNRQDVKDIILGIDKTIAVKDEYMESPVYGGMSPDHLSSGCKAVIMLAVLDNINIYATRCGDNCVPYILKIAEKKDITITLHHCMDFPDKFNAYLIEPDKYISSMEEFVIEYYKYKHKIEDVQL